jgi:hypothetical protein
MGVPNGIMRQSLPGGDLLSSGWLGDSAVDRLEGRDGNDHLDTFNHPASRDVVGCCAGRDHAALDRKAVVGDDCQRVRVVHGTEAEVGEQEQAFFESLPLAVLEFFNTFNRLAPDPTAGG